ncbi:UvrB/UvrC motif-containing protein [Salibacterium qingdaonense]|uniref:Protein-arginine kinase activator protein McsA n=1 Tax=Salibacterium qingdaonense TaxID=266892 RepID=A0A1I4QEX5_9BACI|nr:UvrB/UvrC motif-containing protein [Salibacterium qingdaonense]SFM38567.1 Protein-arginine kinase activator protein McsA [Salibacterium qingdaonense]
MLCQECQTRQAALHFTKIINGKKAEMHLCDKCARNKGEQIPGSNSYSIHELLSGLLNVEHISGNNGFKPQETEEPRQPVCDRCGLTYERFAKTGRFGCARCYQAFETKLDSILKRAHSGNHRHTGKIPKRTGGNMKVQREMEELREDLRTSIEQEEFEEAARLRDHIRELERKMQSGEEDA